MVEAGVVGFKCFLCPSGVEEFPEVSKQDVEATLKELEGTNSVLAVSQYKSITNFQ
jgi:allantoinase